jgi:hypothetical protein
MRTTIDARTKDVERLGTLPPERPAMQKARMRHQSAGAASEAAARQFATLLRERYNVVARAD